MKAKTILAVLAIAAIAGGLYAWKEYSRPTEAAADMRTTETVSATDLHVAFVADEDAATAQYVGTKEQAIQVTGVVRSIEELSPQLVNVILETDDAMAGVVCEFTKADVPASWKEGDVVALKGICTGINDLIPDVILVRCGAVE